MDSPPPTLCDILYLVADNGYGAEVGATALGVNRESWNDERLLRSLAGRLYTTRKTTRLEHAASIGDAARVKTLCAFARPGTVALALRVALYKIVTHGDVADLLVGSGPDIGLLIDQQRFANDGQLQAEQQVISRLLCLNPAVPPRYALELGVQFLLPEVVRSSLAAGIAEIALGFNESPSNEMVFCAGCELIIALHYINRPPIAGELEVLRILFSHPSCTLIDSLIAAGQTNSPEWFHELLTAEALELIAQSPTEDLNAVFWAACAVGDVPAATRLLAAGASGDAVIPPSLGGSFSSATVNAACRGRSGIVSLLAATSNAASVLLSACHLGLTDVARYAVIERGANIKALVDSSDCELGTGHTKVSPLSLACGNGHLETVDMLLDLGADSRSREVLASLLRGCAPSSVKLEILAQLTVAGLVVSSVEGVIFDAPLSSDSAPLLRALLDAGCDINAMNEVGATALHLACSKYRQWEPRDAAILPLLLSYNICDAEALITGDARELSGYRLVSMTGNTPLQVACCVDNVVACRALLAHGVAVNRACGALSRTALHMAGVNGHADCVLALLTGGADAGAVDAEGHTVWDISGLAVLRVLRSWLSVEQ